MALQRWDDDSWDSDRKQHKVSIRLFRVQEKLDRNELTPDQLIDELKVICINLRKKEGTK